MSVSHLNVILFYKCDIEPSHNPIMACSSKNSVCIIHNQTAVDHDNAHTHTEACLHTWIEACSDGGKSIYIILHANWEL